MFPDLPEHLQTLNTIHGNTPPSNGMNQEQEEAFWGFLHTDELFRNFGNPPSPAREDKNDEFIAAATVPPPAPTPITVQEDKQTGNGNGIGNGSAPTLESFIAAFIGQPNTHNNNNNNNVVTGATINAIPPNYLVPLPTPYLQTAPGSPLHFGMSTSDLFPSSASVFDGESPDDRISGAKRLKQLGAGQAEIEEDKRRRNTEASARFRAKKKERESLLEVRAKELEAQVAALAAENSSLENENRLLKAIVLNGPGASANGIQGSAELLQTALAAFGGAKRKRED